MKDRVESEDLLRMLNTLTEDVKELMLFMSTPEFINLSRSKQVEHIEKIEVITYDRDRLNDKINSLAKYAPNVTDKLYLSEIINKEKPNFGSNNLILSPTGSGKTTLIKEQLISKEDKIVLMLVSNETLKSQLAPDDNDERKVLGNRMFTTSNKKSFGSEPYKIHLMTYAEFGERMYINDSFWKDISKVFCDEIHSLPEYIKYGAKTNGGLIHAQRLLFNSYEDKVIYYFTATDENLVKMERDRPGTLSCVRTFDYRNYKNIMKFLPILSREITHIEQIRQYLRDRSVGFEYYNYKGIAFSKKISSLKRISEIVIEEGFNPLVLWSINNDEHVLSKEQIEARDELLKTNKIPEPYDFLIYNSAYQEGWNLKDDSVKLAIINTTNETEYVQALGRLRRDVDLLIYRSRDNKELKAVAVDKKYLDVNLTSKDKKILAEEMSVYGARGNKHSWRGLKVVIEDSGYLVKDKTVTIEGKQVRTSVIIEDNQDY